MSALLDHIVRSHLQFALGGMVPGYDDGTSGGVPQAAATNNIGWGNNTPAGIQGTEVANSETQSSDPNIQSQPTNQQGGSGLFGSLSNVNAGWALPQSSFQATAAGQGTGTTQLNDQGNLYGQGAQTGYNQQASTFGAEQNLGNTLQSEVNGGR